MWELGHVVAAHVLDDLATALGHSAVRRDHLHADYGVPGAAVQPFQRAVYAGGQRTADGGPLGQGRVDCQELAVFLENLLEPSHGNAGPERWP